MGPEKDQSDAPLVAPLSSITSSDVSTVSPFNCFKSKQWWKNTSLLSLLYARHCLLPAALWLVSLAILLLPSAFIYMTFGKTVEISQLLQALVVFLLTLLVELPLLFWCFGAWLIRLTAYSAAFHSFSRQEMIAANLDKSRILDAQRHQLEHAKTKKVFFAKFWSTLTLLLIVPGVVFFVSMMILACSSSAVLGVSAIKLPIWASVLTNVCCLVSGFATTVISFVGICLSATAETDPVRLAKNTVSLSFKGFLPLTIIAASSLLVSVLITSPYDLAQGGSASFGSLNVTWVTVAQEVWRAVSSTVVWSFTLAPICEYMRDKQP